jgi:predicted nucleic acid-binding protein
VVVVDSSAWVELFRDTRSPVALALERLLREQADLAVTEIVVLELLAGARNEVELRELQARLHAFPVLPLDGLAAHEAAAALYRACRRAGETIRTLLDCLVAVPVIRTDSTLLAADRDFEVLARHTPLRLEPVAP